MNKLLEELDNLLDEDNYSAVEELTEDEDALVESVLNQVNYDNAVVYGIVVSLIEGIGEDRLAKKVNKILTKEDY